MRTTVTARHCTVADQLKEHARALLAKTATLAPEEPIEGSIVFDVDHGKRVVELQVHFAGGRRKIATGEADEFRTALDRATDKLRNQLDKSGRRTTRRSPAW